MCGDDDGEAFRNGERKDVCDEAMRDAGVCLDDDRGVSFPSGDQAELLGELFPGLPLVIEENLRRVLCGDGYDVASGGSAERDDLGQVDLEPRLQDKGGTEEKKEQQQQQHIHERNDVYRSDSSGMDIAVDFHFFSSFGVFFSEESFDTGAFWVAAGVAGMVGLESVRSWTTSIPQRSMSTTMACTRDAR